MKIPWRFIDHKRKALLCISQSGRAIDVRKQKKKERRKNKSKIDVAGEKKLRDEVRN